jgi:hypothetical protein
MRLKNSAVSMQLEDTLALTPALSPGERENLWQTINELTIWRIPDVGANARILRVEKPLISANPR